MLYWSKLTNYSQLEASLKWTFQSVIIVNWISLTFGWNNQSANIILSPNKTNLHLRHIEWTEEKKKTLLVFGSLSKIPVGFPSLNGVYTFIPPSLLPLWSSPLSLLVFSQSYYSPVTSQCLHQCHVQFRVPSVRGASQTLLCSSYWGMKLLLYPLWALKRCSADEKFSTNIGSEERGTRGGGKHNANHLRIRAPSQRRSFVIHRKYIWWRDMIWECV